MVAITQYFLGPSEEKMFRGAGEMAQSLAVLSEDSTFDSAPTWAVTIIRNSSSRVCCLLLVSKDTHASRQSSQTLKIKMNESLKKI